MARPPDQYFPDPSRLAARLGVLKLRTPTPFDREPDLLELSPVATSKMAAIIVSSDLLVRRSWTESVEMSERLLDAIAPAGAPPVPRAFAKSEHRFRLEGEPVERARCTHCPIRRGFGPCGLCAGTGTVFRDGDGSNAPVAVSCGCEGGLAPCGACGGTGESVRATVHHATDEPIHDRRVVVPTLVGTLDDVVRSAIAGIEGVMDAFQIELEPSVTQSAYRGATGVEKPDFYGYEFLDAWERARAFVRAPAPGTVLRLDRAWAWPFLCVRWSVKGSDVDVGIVPLTDGSWRAVFANPLTAM